MASRASKTEHEKPKENRATSSSVGNTHAYVSGISFAFSIVTLDYASGPSLTPGYSRTSSNSDTKDPPSIALPQASRETSIEDVPPPAYGETYGQVDFSQDGFNTEARVASR